MDNIGELFCFFERFSCNNDYNGKTVKVKEPVSY